MNKNNLFMKGGFVNKFVSNQLNISKIKKLSIVNYNKINIDELKDFEEDEELSLIQKKSDFNKIIKIEFKRRKEYDNDRV
jgi:hypothetical protein